ncbi:DUF4352 domain-containing protein [Virgibacillus oceani]
MRKLFIILLAGIFIAGCNGNDEEENSNGEMNGNDQAEENNGDDDGENNEDNGDEQTNIYQIGETAEGTSSSYGFPYEVTVNDFEVTGDEVAGNTLEDIYAEGFEPSEDARFAVVNVTLNNTGDDSFVPNDTMSPTLDGEFTSEYPDMSLSPELDAELNPGEEVTADLVFIIDTLFQEDGVVNLVYNIHDPNHEFHFELPIPEQ